MNKINLVIGIIGIIAMVAIVLSVVAISSLEKVKFGSTHFTGPIYSEEGYVVDSTTIIDGDGNIDSGGVIVGTSVTVTDVSATNVTASGESNVDDFVQGGTVLSIGTASSTLTAAQMCDSAVISFNGYHLEGAQQDVVHFASSSDLIADCLTADGDFQEFKLRNNCTGTLKVVFERETVTQLLDLIRNVTSSDAIGKFAIDADEALNVKMQRIGSTTTLEFMHSKGH